MSVADTIGLILGSCRTIAVVGLSPQPYRPSHGVSAAMQAQGYRIIPVNPYADRVLGEKAYPSLTEAAQHERIELVNIFRNPEDVPPLIDEAIAVGARAVWMQLGIAHAGAALKAEAAGLLVVQDACIAVELARLAAR
ncbi:CoA-binding protein [Ramlibacter sp. 2FC]|uniref:CoA-binding protein n=1 Tax=Ramlibacter sp. 2FC TaxID=2502188 RepID=UPI0010F8B7BE|nr:CoA-binding protein [Ramlibacter sp. 2FC]